MKKVIDGQTYTCKVAVSDNGKKLGKKKEKQAAILENSVYLEYAPGNMEESVVDDIQPVNKLPKDWKVTWKSSMPSVVAPSIVMSSAGNCFLRSFPGQVSQSGSRRGYL